MYSVYNCKAHDVCGLDGGVFLVWVYGLLALNTVSLAIALMAWAQSRSRGREARELHRQVALCEQRLVKLERALIQQQGLITEACSDAKGATASLTAVADRLTELEAKQGEIISKQTEFEHREESSPLYTHAARLVDSGATIDDLMQECDLPRAEAELLISLRAK